MQPFLFIRADNKKDALQKANEREKYIAGGTNLVDLMKSEIETPQSLIAIHALDELKIIAKNGSGNIMIGAMVTNSELAYHPLITEKLPVLSQAILSGASPQIRNLATTGGNLLQRTRCPYFYDTAFACNKRKPGSGCSAITGYNRSHAILGTSEHCIATHPSDMCVALAALDAIVHVEGKSGERKIAFTDFHIVPGDTPNIETVLKPGELITAIEIPVTAYNEKSNYLKVRDRASYEFALSSAATILDISGGKIRTAKIALGGIGTKPWRAAKAEEALKDKEPTEQNFKAAAEIALQEAKPYNHNQFKIELAKRTLIKGLLITGGLYA